MVNPNFNNTQYLQGRNAYKNGYERSQNPYSQSKDGENHDLWNQGFDWEKALDEPAQTETTSNQT